jgi:sugar phosphate isomerase/epimerase
MKIGFHTDAFNSAYWSFDKCLALLRDTGYQGVASIECEGQAGPMIEQSLAWLRKTITELNISY